MWEPSETLLQGRKYVVLVEILERDIEQGRLKPGERLPPQRRLSELFGVTIATVTRAIAEAKRRGLVTTTVGRGTYVAERRPAGRGAQEGHVELGINILPPGLVSDLLAVGMSEASRGSDAAELFRYATYAGNSAELVLCGDWLAANGVSFPGDAVRIPTHGVQHGLLAAIYTLSRAGDTILVEELAYTGTLRAAALLGVRTLGVGMDAQGVRPDALDYSLGASGARLVVLTPTVQNPTGRTMGATRREQVAAVLRMHDAFLLEDAVNMPLVAESPAPLACSIPERTILLAGFSKCAASGLRLGIAYVPPDLHGRFHDALVTLVWLAPQAMIGLTARLIESGRLDACVVRHRAEALDRQALAGRILGDLCSDEAAAAFHVWIALPKGWTAEVLARAAIDIGLRVTSSRHFCPENVATPQAVRVCLGAEPERTRLAKGLRALARLLRRPPPVDTAVF